MSASKSSLAALTLGAIGVVYGDIGTSVLYSVKEVFGSGHVQFTNDNVYGILSIFFWTLTVIVSLKYVTLVLRADNHGEGGLVAMLALASQSVKEKPALRRRLLAVGAVRLPDSGRLMPAAAQSRFDRTGFGRGSGLKARDEIMVATILLESWMPLRKSKSRAAATRITMMAA